MTHGGRDAFRTLIGGLVSILTVGIIIAYGCREMFKEYYNPVYNQLPTTFDFNYKKTIDMDWRRNMVSYQIYSKELLAHPLQILRPVFRPANIGYVIPAVYCYEYYADEIAAEKNGQSDSTFYTDTYLDLYAAGWGRSDWICPNLTDSMVTEIDTNNLRV